MSLPTRVREQLDRLNDARYIAFKRDELAALWALRKALPAPLHYLEIGSNRGDFALGLAERHPHQQVLALEWRQKWVDQLRARVRDRGLRNLACVRADARLALPVLLYGASLRAVFILFPDPWWKHRHKARRLIDPPFLRLVGELLAPDGVLFIKTDAIALYEEIREAAESTSELLEVVPPWAWPDERGWAPSAREHKQLRAGVAIYRLVFRRALPIAKGQAV